MREVLRVLTRSAKETKRFAEAFAKETLRLKNKRAVVIGLVGALGAGKTTFVKGFARGLGIKEEIKSPTFILMRVFKFRGPTSKGSRGRTSYFFHIDAYRDQIDFRKFLNDRKNILLIEWADKVKNLLPKKYFRFVLRGPTSRRLRGRTSREIRFYA